MNDRDRFADALLYAGLAPVASHHEDKLFLQVAVESYGNPYSLTFEFSDAGGHFLGIRVNQTRERV